MLRIYRRHEKRCSLTSKADPNCPGKLKCPIWITGTLPDGTDLKPKTLNTRNWTVAAQRALEMEAGVKPVVAKITVAEAIKSYRAFKEKRSADTKRKNKLLTDRLQTFLEKRSIFHIADVKLPDLSAFRETWTGADTTRRRDQEILKSFFWYCYHSDFLTKNPVVHLDPISVTRAKTQPFTHEQQIAIFNALADFPDEYGRHGTPIAAQTKAFVYVLRYTGMAIGDVAKLEKDHVQDCRIRTHRKKTGEDVFAKVPQFVIDTLNSAPHDSETFFFWSGEGLIHTRASKWGNRLRKLFKLAKIEGCTPYMFRHTLARDFLEDGGSMAELAELLGNSTRVCERYYSKWDKRRQDRLERNLDKLRENDPITKLLANRETRASFPAQKYLS
jgi:integrase